MKFNANEYYVGKARPLRVFQDSKGYYVMRGQVKKRLRVTSKGKVPTTRAKAQQIVIKKLKGRNVIPKQPRKVRPVKSTVSKLYSFALGNTGWHEVKSKYQNSKELTELQKQLAERQLVASVAKEELAKANKVIKDADDKKKATVNKAVATRAKNKAAEKAEKKQADLDKAAKSAAQVAERRARAARERAAVPPVAKKERKTAGLLLSPARMRRDTQAAFDKFGPAEKEEKEEKYPEVGVAAAPAAPADLADPEFDLGDLKLDYDEEDSDYEGFGKNPGPSDPNSLLPALWNDQIDKFFKDQPLFTGTYSIDEVKDIPKQIPQGFIINTAKHNRPGEHWQAVYISPDAVEFYDSYGDKPDTILVKQIKQKLEEWHVPTMMKFKINNVAGQNDSSDTCGYFAMRFLDERFHDVPFDQVTRFVTPALHGQQGGRKIVHLEGKGEGTIKKEFQLI